MEHNFINEESEVESHIARWDGLAWQPIGVADAGYNALTTFRDNLVTGGMFTSMGGKVVNHVAGWIAH